MFLASIALVSVVLPNLYFRVMLYTDNVTNKQAGPRVQTEKFGMLRYVERPGWIHGYQDTSWFVEVKRRKLKKLFKNRKWRKQKNVL